MMCHLCWKKKAAWRSDYCKECQVWLRFLRGEY